MAVVVMGQPQSGELQEVAAVHDILSHVFSFMHLDEVKRCMFVCKAWCELAEIGSRFNVDRYTFVSNNACYDLLRNKIMYRTPFPLVSYAYGDQFSRTPYERQEDFVRFGDGAAVRFMREERSNGQEVIVAFSLFSGKELWRRSSEELLPDHMRLRIESMRRVLVARKQGIEDANQRRHLEGRPPQEGSIEQLEQVVSELERFDRTANKVLTVHFDQKRHFCYVQYQWCIIVLHMKDGELEYKTRLDLGTGGSQRRDSEDDQLISMREMSVTRNLLLLPLTNGVIAAVEKRSMRRVFSVTLSPTNTDMNHLRMEMIETDIEKRKILVVYDLSNSTATGFRITQGWTTRVSNVFTSEIVGACGMHITDTHVLVNGNDRLQRVVDLEDGHSVLNPHDLKNRPTNRFDILYESCQIDEDEGTAYARLEGFYTFDRATESEIAAAWNTAMGNTVQAILSVRADYRPMSCVLHAIMKEEHIRFQRRQRETVENMVTAQMFSCMMPLIPQDLLQDAGKRWCVTVCDDSIIVAAVVDGSHYLPQVDENDIQKRDALYRTFSDERWRKLHVIVYCIDAQTGNMRWQNTDVALLDPSQYDVRLMKTYMKGGILFVHLCLEAEGSELALLLNGRSGKLLNRFEYISECSELHTVRTSAVDSHTLRMSNSV